ncbi:MAG: ribosomal-processing cysteine protease Prp [Christensenellaceae bacterium]|jgi:uncharacterized protein YsxB (DUF464 family)|nr:ribosomal-processing cysteine protease Prp [Christensenellaceae bacterium]
MTTINVVRKEGRIIRVEASGHSNYAIIGKDIVCAAISTVLQGTILGLIEVAKVKTDKAMSDGNLSFSVSDTNISTRHSADIILETMCVVLKDIARCYPSHLKLEDSKNVF